MDNPRNDRVLAALAPRDMELGPPASPQSTNRYKNWRVVHDKDDIAWTILDKHDSSANTLNAEVLEELDAIVASFEAARPKAVVIRSGKTGGFVYGADISLFKELKDEATGVEFMTRAHAVIDRLEALTIPVIAVVHGAALGGGLELALAAHLRIGVEGSSYGFPEVQLGLHPGLGGTVRLPRLIDPVEAMTAMLTGGSIHDKKAKALGLIDALVPERHVHAAVMAAVAGTLEGHRPTLVDRLKDSGPARRLLAQQMRATAEKQAPSAHYPAPYALIDLWEKHGGDPKAMQAGEIKSFAHLITTQTSRNLVRVFFLRENLKALAGKTPAIKHVHVIGAGAMGGDIAAWCAWRGLTVTLSDIKPEFIAGAVKRANALYVKIGHKDGIKVRDALDRLIPDFKGEGIPHADLIIEAAPEKPELKEKIYAATEPRMKPGAILATNTSSIPLATLAATLKRPERFVGIHFFNPVSRMQLVEVVSHDGIDPQVETAARAFTGLIDRLPAPAKSAPGFIVNRALTPYLAEALIMLDEGIAPETIDKAAEDFGMPMGPIELADTVGLDIAVAVSDSLKRDLNWPLPDAPDWLRKKVADKKLGKKTGEGLYVWKEGKPVKAKDAPPPAPDMADRLILPLLNTCVALRREGVSDSDDVVDAAMIFGTGFAPFTGGPLNYAKQRGVVGVKAKLAELEGTYGERFKPDAGWEGRG